VVAEQRATSGPPLRPVKGLPLRVPACDATLQPPATVTPATEPTASRPSPTERSITPARASRSGRLPTRQPRGTPRQRRPPRRGGRQSGVYWVLGRAAALRSNRPPRVHIAARHSDIVTLSDTPAGLQVIKPSNSRDGDEVEREAVTVADVMTRELQTATLETAVMDAVETMQAEGIGRRAPRRRGRPSGVPRWRRRSRTRRRSRAGWGNRTYSSVRARDTPIYGRNSSA
jgi:CBS domain-containing protein